MVYFSGLFAKGGGMKIKIFRKDKRINKEVGQKVEKSNEVCTICSCIIENGNPTRFSTKDGVKHWGCVIKKPMQNLRSAGLSPSCFSTPNKLFKCLVNEAKKLLDKKPTVDKEALKKLEVIHEVAEELFPGKSIVSKIAPPEAED